MTQLYPVASTQSHISDTHTMIDMLPSAHNICAGRKFAILIKAFSQDRTDFESQTTSAASSIMATVAPNQYLIDWTIQYFSINPETDSLVLINVRPQVASDRSKAYDTSIAAYANMYDAELARQSNWLLDKHLSRLQDAGYRRCRAVTLKGDTSEEARAYADSHQLTGIVVGSRRGQQRKTPLSFLRRGRVANSLVQSSAVPVTVVKLPPAK